jgi:serine/threonine-protein kinase
MLDPQATRFWLAALQSGLMDAQGLKACWEAIPPEKREVIEHVDRRLARQSVQRNYLTLWQAQQLLAGRSSGFRVDRYLLLDLIGHGGMGRVYLARDTRLNRLVALKILAPERMNNPRAIARFQREARVGAQLQHEHLVRIYDFGESSGRYYLVMEFIEGKTIGALISAQGPMPPPTAARLTRQIALGLEHAHRKGLIHRDVNPYNVLVTHDGIAKLADLGLAIDLAEEERVTREGATVGTFDYVAPEQARHSHSADIRSDIYSLGCTLYHMIAGQVPFPSPSLPEKLFAHQAMEPIPLNQLVAEIPPGLAEVVQRMMRKLPEERYTTPLQVAQALVPFIDELATLNDGEPAPEPLIPDKTAETERDASSHSGEVPTDRTVPPTFNTAPEFAERATPAMAHSLPMAGARDTGVPSFSSGMSEGHEAVVAPSVLTPVSDNEVGSEEDIPLFLDLGPEPSLTDSLTRPRSWFTADKPGKPSSAADVSTVSDGFRPALALRALIRTVDRRWLWGIAFLVVTLALLLLGLVLTRRFRTNPSTTQAPHGVAQNSRAILKSSRFPQGDTERKNTSGYESTPGIIVLGEDGSEVPVTDLLEAIQHAIGGKGWVVLRNRTALRLPGGLTTASATKEWLKIRGADDLNPVLEVELKDRKPFLTVGSGMNLVIEGLTIIAHYPDQTSTGPLRPWPIILTSGGSVQVRHCAFEVAGETMTIGTRAVVADGGNLTVENCWFKGFHIAVDVHASGGSATIIRESMVIPAGRGASTSSAPVSAPGMAPADWGVRVEHMGGGRTAAPRTLVLDRCTITSTGLLQMDEFSPASPLDVDIKGCAIRTAILLGWESSGNDTPFDPKTLRWRGEGNQFDISGREWISQSPKASTHSTSTIANLDQWSKIVIEDEPVTGTIEFSVRSEGRAESLQPSDFAIKSTAEYKPGADPEKVGPRRARSIGPS